MLRSRYHLAMEVVDADGDRLLFRIDAKGHLVEYVNGKLDCRALTKIQYVAEEGKVVDDTGMFIFRPENRTEQALGLRALAARAGVTWSGDEPQPATFVRLTDTDGDALEFSLTEAGKLQETNKGVLELEAVSYMKFTSLSGTVEDPGGTFTLQSHECVQKAAALESIAMQAGVHWISDGPGRATNLGQTPSAIREASGVLDIEDCPAAWDLECPKEWSKLTPTATPNVRFCGTCKENVFFCSTEEELQANTDARHCVAFELRSAKASGSGTSVDAGAAAADSEKPSLVIRAVALSGQEFLPVQVDPSATVARLREALAAVSGIPASEQRLLLGLRELTDLETLPDVGVDGLGFVQVVRVVPEPETKKPLRKKMGKRMAPPSIDQR